MPRSVPSRAPPVEVRRGERGPARRGVVCCPAVHRYLRLAATAWLLLGALTACGADVPSPAPAPRPTAPSSASAPPATAVVTASPSAAPPGPPDCTSPAALGLTGVPERPVALRRVLDEAGKIPYAAVALGKEAYLFGPTSLQQLTSSGLVPRPERLAGFAEGGRLLALVGDFADRAFAYRAEEDYAGALYAWKGDRWVLRKATPTVLLEPIGPFAPGGGVLGLVHGVHVPEDFSAAIWGLVGSPLRMPRFATHDSGPDAGHTRNEPIVSLSLPGGGLFVAGMEPRGAEPHAGILEVWAPGATQSTIVPLPHPEGQRALPTGLAGRPPSTVLVATAYAPSRTSQFERTALSLFAGGAFVPVPSPAPDWDLGDGPLAMTESGSLYTFGRRVKGGPGRALFQRAPDGTLGRVPWPEPALASCEPAAVSFELFAVGEGLVLVATLAEPEGAGSGPRTRVYWSPPASP